MSREPRLSRRAAALLSVTAALLSAGVMHLVTTSAAEPAPRPATALPSGPRTVTVTPTPTPATSTAAAPTPSPVVEPPRDCRPLTDPVDPDAGPAAQCLAETLDTWMQDGSTAIGQQVNISSDTWDQPLRALRPARPAVVGFDLDELVDAARRGQDWTEDLALLAGDGAVLTASWHARNPFTGGDSFDRTGSDRLADLLDARTPPAQRFDRQWNEVLDLLAELQSYGAAVVVRPLHEAGGDWFWWGRPDPATYKRLYAHLQQQAADAGVHNLLWAYGAAVKTWEGIDDPMTLLPPDVDLVGLDTYDCETVHPDCGGRSAQELAVDEVDLTGYAALAAAAPRIALTEVGPAHSPDGDWDPAVITRTLRQQGLPAAYALLWFDDQAGRKQVSSLRGGKAWLASCRDGVCRAG